MERLSMISAGRAAIAGDEETIRAGTFANADVCVIAKSRKRRGQCTRERGHGLVARLRRALLSRRRAPGATGRKGGRTPVLVTGGRAVSVEVPTRARQCRARTPIRSQSSFVQLSPLQVHRDRHREVTMPVVVSFPPCPASRTRTPLTPADRQTSTRQFRLAPHTIVGELHSPDARHRMPCPISAMSRCGGEEWSRNEVRDAKKVSHV